MTRSLNLLRHALAGAATAALIYAIRHIPLPELLNGDIEYHWDDDDDEYDWATEHATCCLTPPKPVIITEEDDITDLL